MAFTAGVIAWYTWETQKIRKSANEQLDKVKNQTNINRDMLIQQEKRDRSNLYEEVYSFFYDFILNPINNFEDARKGAEIALKFDELCTKIEIFEDYLLIQFFSEAQLEWVKYKDNFDKIQKLKEEKKQLSVRASQNHNDKINTLTQKNLKFLDGIAMLSSNLQTKRHTLNKINKGNP